MKKCCTQFRTFYGVIFLLGIIGWECLTPSAEAIDVYVLFSGKDKADKKALSQALPPEISKKFYNVDLLALADYSGKQKVVTKFSKATVVVTLRDAPHNALKGIEVSSPLLIVQSAKEGMGTQKQKLYILKKDTDVSSLEKNTTLEVSSEDDLRNKNNMESSQIIFVDKGLELSQAVSVIVDKVLSRLR